MLSYFIPLESTDRLWQSLSSCIQTCVVGLSVQFLEARGEMRVKQRERWPQGHLIVENAVFAFERLSGCLLLWHKSEGSNV